MPSLFGISVSPWTLVAFASLSLLTLALGGVFTEPGPWYQALEKPPVTPPGWFIGFAWWIIFALLTVAMSVVWSARPRDAWTWTTMGILAVNLVLNAGWSYLFFTRHAIQAALVELAVLWVSTVTLALAAATKSHRAAALLTPYAAWVAFAGYLNWRILQLNA